MVVMCKAAGKRGTKCIHKRNTKSPYGLQTEFCAISATPTECTFAQEIEAWEKKEGNFELTLKAVSP